MKKESKFDEWFLDQYEPREGRFYKSYEKISDPKLAAMEAVGRLASGELKLRRAWDGLYETAFHAWQANPRKEDTMKKKPAKKKTVKKGK